MSGFRASVDRLTLLLEVNDFKLKPVLIKGSENPRDLKNYTEVMPVLCKWKNKAWMTALLFITWFIFEPTCSGKDSK